MNLLLDTHIFLWSLLEPRRLTQTVVEALENPGNQLWLSSISVWEILVLAEKGRIELTSAPQQWVREALKKAPLREVGINHEVALQSRIVSVSPQDPADRFLAATAVTGASKKHHTCAPFPERERSIANCRALLRQVSAKAVTSSRHCSLSKSTARNQQVSSCRSG